MARCVGKTKRVATTASLKMPQLRDLVHDKTMSPLSNNVYTVLLTVLYVKVGFELASWIRWRMGKRRLPRILVHLCLSSVIIFWPLYDSTNWSWRLNVLVPSTVASRLVYKVRRRSYVIFLNTKCFCSLKLNRACC